MHTSSEGNSEGWSAKISVHCVMKGAQASGSTENLSWGTGAAAGESGVVTAALSPLAAAHDT